MTRKHAVRSILEPMEGRCLPSATLSIGDVALVEGHSGSTAFVFTVRLTEPSTSRVSVRYSTADLTATAQGGDYQRAVGTLTFAPGETVKSVTVLVRGDTRVEADEQFAVKLDRPRNALISKAIGIGTILNDDTPPPPPVDPPYIPPWDPPDPPADLGG